MINKLEINNVSKYINRKTIIEQISFTCKSGEVIGIVGPNGYGKSSIFKIISGLWYKTSGTILINNKQIEPSNTCMLKKISSFIERPNVYENLTVEENIKIITSLYGISNLEWVNFLIERLNITSFKNKRLKKCSLGMKQKVGILISLINDGDIIILDEPTNSLDIDSVKTIHEIIKILKEKDKIILVSSHIIEELESIVDKVIILKDGHIKGIYNKHIDENIYIVQFKENITKDKLLNNEEVISVHKVEQNLAEIKISDINKFMKECILNEIEISSISKKTNLLRDLMDEEK